ncbi:hypothetical protein KEM48_005720 [Puccinia striiformis f. sp. tritici PST-130]|uniref:Uncharacterized protein n=1 Tax=Puccinia striiformis f. sp. tritici PST-78 TaxID=1165861 RepID=A0A0L0V693_9BASI|nr:hypothetical protein KEM48_005720 [Puccinia striiformis f. sp. tritici PST-130]KNE94711.1 hypothetical protein PSTG_11899 [Puccinia striiformis f. sp. tritici PST-78]
MPCTGSDLQRETLRSTLEISACGVSDFEFDVLRAHPRETTQSVLQTQQTHLELARAPLISLHPVRNQPKLDTLAIKQTKSINRRYRRCHGITVVRV